MKNTLERIIFIFAEHHVIDASDLSESTLLAELGGDSLDAVEICMELEEEFDVTLENFDRCKTIGDISSHVQKLLDP